MERNVSELNNPRAQEFVELVDAARAITFVDGTHGSAVRGGTDHSTVTAIALHDVRHDLGDAVTALTLIRSLLLEARQRWRALLPVIASLPQSQGSLPPKAERELARIFEIGPETEVLLKALYQTLYAVEELLEGPELGGIVDRSTMRQLRSVTSFRHHAITHKRGARVFRRGLRSFQIEELEQRFGQASPASVSQEMQESVAAIWQGAIAAGLALGEEENVFARLQLLQERQSQLPESLQGPTKALFRKFGVQSHSPIELAELVYALCTIFFSTRFGDLAEP